MRYFFVLKNNSNIPQTNLFNCLDKHDGSLSIGYKTKKTDKPNYTLKNVIVSGVILLLICFLSIIILLFPTEADAVVYDKVVRFHIIANSDTLSDQKVKLELRDAVIKEYTKKLGQFNSKEDAHKYLSENIESINNFCDNFLNSTGKDLKCKTEIGEEFYNRTEYKNLVMPSGNYTSLKITIGDGEGANWWCVMFPPICTKAAMNTVIDSDIEDSFIEAGFTGEQYRLLTQSETPKYRVKFRLLEIIFGK